MQTLLKKSCVCGLNKLFSPSPLSKLCKVINMDFIKACRSLFLSSGIFSRNWLNK